jgi:hypothetical protein
MPRDNPPSDPSGFAGLWDAVLHNGKTGYSPPLGEKRSHTPSHLPQWLPTDMDPFTTQIVGAAFTWAFQRTEIHFTYPGWRDASQKFMSTPEVIVQAVKDIAEMYRAEISAYPPQSGLAMQYVYGLHWLQNINTNVPIAHKKWRGMDQPFGNEIGSGIIASPFKTIRQHRWFFANMPHVPYSRRNQLSAGWVVNSSGKLTVRVTNKTPYAWVMHGNDTQSMYAAASGWRTVAVVVETYKDRATEIMKTAIQGILGNSPV